MLLGVCCLFVRLMYAVWVYPYLKGALFFYIHPPTNARRTLNNKKKSLLAVCCCLLADADGHHLGDDGSFYHHPKDISGSFPLPSSVSCKLLQVWDIEYSINGNEGFFRIENWSIECRVVETTVLQSLGVGFPFCQWWVMKRGISGFGASFRSAGNGGCCNNWMCILMNVQCWSNIMFLYLLLWLP